MIGLVVPVLNNFRGFTELIHSIRKPVYPIVIDNWNGNRGVAKAWNEGIKEAVAGGCSHIAVVNDDVVFDRPDTLLILANTLDANPHIDLLTPTNTREDVSGFDNHPDFSAFMISPQFVNKFGWFDENIYPAYFEDNDMAYRVTLGGGVWRNIRDIKMLHRGSQTQNMVPHRPVVPSKKFEEIRAYYIRKWGGTPGKETFSNPFNDPNKTFKDW